MNRDIEQEKQRLEEALLSQEELTEEQKNKMMDQLLEDYGSTDMPELIQETDEALPDLETILEETELTEEPAEEPEEEALDEEQILEELLQEQQPDTTEEFSGELPDEKRAPLWFPILVLLVMAVLTGYVVATLVRFFL